MPESRPQPEVAFLAAALALLVMPLLVVVGMAAFGLAASYMMPADRLMEGNGIWVLVAVFVIWVLVAVAIVLMLIARLSRPTTRP
jgi:TRAP-type C4-dicarboxylate transport system permease small subunit